MSKHQTVFETEDVKEDDIQDYYMRPIDSHFIEEWLTFLDMSTKEDDKK